MEATIKIKKNAAKLLLRQMAASNGVFAMMKMAQGQVPKGHTQKEMEEIVH